MSDKSAIEWTDATWNPVTGCTKISPGCDNCYAETFAERWRGIKGHHYEQGFDLKLWPARLNIPLKWEKPRMIFVNSMSDLFHINIPDQFILDVIDIMEKAHWHTFQILTKRAKRLTKFGFPQNAWIGTSIELASRKYRMDSLKLVHMSDPNPRVRFLSLEPLLGDLGELDLEGIHWVIVGGESGPGARPMKVEWVRNIRDQCKDQGVPFFFKQWGGVQKKKNGRLLDGQEYNEMPKTKQGVFL